MRHWKTVLDPGEYLGPQDFPQPAKLIVSRIEREKVSEREEQEAPMIYFATPDGKEIPRKYKCPKSVLYGLNLALGKDLDKWKGKEVELYAAQCYAFGEIEDCIRIKFSKEIEDNIIRWMKRRKANPASYKIGKA